MSTCSNGLYTTRSKSSFILVNNQQKEKLKKTSLNYPTRANSRRNIA
jgi:hypothetical protein